MAAATHFKPATRSSAKSSTRSQKKQQKPATTVPKRCLFMELPREVRDQIYDYVAADSKALLNPRHHAEISSSSPLSRVNKQIRAEFLTALRLGAGSLWALVVNFNFSHIVTFFNRLSEREERSQQERALEEGQRELQIVLSFNATYSAWLADPLLERWINRVADMRKRGTDAECSYHAPRSEELEGWSDRKNWSWAWGRILHYEGWLRDSYVYEELLKVWKAVGTRMHGMSWNFG